MTPIYRSKLPKKAIPPKAPHYDKEYRNNFVFRHEHPDNRTKEEWIKLMQRKYNVSWA